MATGRALLEELAAMAGGADEARWIMAAALGVPVATLALSLGEDLPAPVLAAARQMAARRAAGEPLQHVLGSWSFRTLDVRVDSRALVPRPETEVVVAVALEELAAAAAQAGPGATLAAADLGTGSGVIALSLAAEGPTALEVWATDRDPGALALARANLALLGRARPEAASRVQLVEGSWCEPLPDRLRGRLALVVSNPPYVSKGEWERLDPVVRDHDPYGALVAGPTGLEDVTAVLEEARAWLAPGAAVVVELAPQQSGAAASLAAGLGYRDVDVRPDLAGRPRVLVGRRGAS